MAHPYPHHTHLYPTHKHTRLLPPFLSSTPLVLPTHTSFTHKPYPNTNKQTNKHRYTQTHNHNPSNSSPSTLSPTPLVLHPRKGKAALLHAQLLGKGGDGRRGRVVFLVEDKAQVLVFVFCVCGSGVCCLCGCIYIHIYICVCMYVCVCGSPCRARSAGTDFCRWGEGGGVSRRRVCVYCVYIVCVCERERQREREGLWYGARPHPTNPQKESK
jgi:hypothetical protein